MSSNAFEAMDEVQARQAREVPDRIRQVLSIAELAKAGALYYCARSNGPPWDDMAIAWERLADAYQEWSDANPAASAALDEENE